MKFKINFSFIIVFICFIISKYQMEYLCFLLCIFIHELGHLLALRIYKINVKKVTLYSFGLVMTKDDYKGFSDEIIIYSAGIVFNIILLILSNGVLKDICKLLIFINLLPIYPLDGYNIVESLIAYLIPYKYTIILCSIINILSILIVFIIYFNYVNILLIINLLYLLWFPIYKIINIKKIYNSFVINRVLNEKELNYKIIKFNENIHNRLYKYKKIKVILGTNEILEKNIIYNKYKYQ